MTQSVQLIIDLALRQIQETNFQMLSKAKIIEESWNFTNCLPKILLNNNKEAYNTHTPSQIEAQQYGAYQSVAFRIERCRHY